jgi:hypothetical protein
MLEYIHEYPNPAVDEFNEDFIYAKEDIPLEELVTMVMRDFETIENIEILNIETIYDQDDVDYNAHTININFKKKHLDQIEIPKNKFVADTRFYEMRFTYRIHTNLNEAVITKHILLPKEEDGMMLINSKYWKPIWQLCDANTYTQRGKVTFKSRMPIIIYQTKNRLLCDSTGKEWNLTSHSYALDTKTKRRGAKKKTKFINPMMIFAAKMGMHRAIEFFDMGGIIELVDRVDEDLLSIYTYFPMDNVFIRVPTTLMEKYDLVRHVVCMLIYCSNKDFPVEWKDLEDREYWVCRIGYIGSIKNKNIQSFRDKGYTTLHMIERLYDHVSEKDLRLPEFYTQNIYYILYWMILNFNTLKTRNNMDMMNKRVRKNEYIVMSSLGKKVSENINKLIEKKSKSKMNTMDTLLELFNFPSDIILSGMKNLSDVVKSDDIVNDMTFLQDLMYSSKGPNSLGETSSKMISAKYRYLHPSQLGILDLNVSSNSDPGMSGSFVPFVKLYDRFFFNPNPDPCDAEYEYVKVLYEYLKEHPEVLKEYPELKTSWIAKIPARAMTDLDSFIKYTKKQHDSYSEDLKYMPIEIHEKEED